MVNYRSTLILINSFVLLFSFVFSIYCRAEGGGRTDSVVVPQGISLGILAHLLYKDSKIAGQIAMWNQIQNPNRIRSGQRLILKRPPLVSGVTFDLSLLRYWRQHLAKRSLNLLKPLGEARLAQSRSPVQQRLPAALEEVSEKSSERASQERVLQEAQELIVNGQVEDALGIYSSYLKSDPDNRVVLRAFGEAHLKIDHINQALQAFQKLKRLNDLDLVSWLRSIFLLKKLNRTSEEVQAAQEFIVKFPKLKNLGFLKKYNFQ